MGQAIGTYEGVRIYGPRPEAAACEAKAKRQAKKYPNLIDPEAPLVAAIHRRMSSKGKPYFVEGYAIPTKMPGTFQFYSDYNGKVYSGEAQDADIITEYEGKVMKVAAEDDVRMSWDDAKLAWRACRLFAEADLCGKPEQARQLRTEAHGIYGILKSRVTAYQPEQQEGA